MDGGQVCEKLGPSLYDFLRKNSYRSFPIALVREVAKQLLECIAFMHELRLIHTDLKPENILLVSPEYIKVPDYKVSSRSPKEGSYFKRLPKSSAIKVIDFGSTTYDQQDQTYVVSTRHYRAPECKAFPVSVIMVYVYDWNGCCSVQDLDGVTPVISGVLVVYWLSYARYVVGCNIWFVFCHNNSRIFELPKLPQGEALFQTHENLEHLAMMERVFGPLPYHMLKRAEYVAVLDPSHCRKNSQHWGLVGIVCSFVACIRHSEKYVRKGRLNWPEGCASRDSMKAVMKLPRLQNLVMQNVDHSGGEFIDLLQGLLRYDPASRLTAQEALRHPFLRELSERRR
uniref:Protein kinase domain-containing protein n=1 Tax=Oryza barthii TaxID=65489 RepID=A0A0D3EYZ1_9ORYZ